MSEKLYAWLLCLYPSSFRKAYGEQALQLMRDRARNERGLLYGLRLWFDLLWDLGISLPHQYHSVSAVVVAEGRLGDGIPSFHSLEAEALGFRSLLCGGVASLLVYGSVLIFIGHGANLYFKLSPDAQPSSMSVERTPPTITLSYSPTDPAPGATVTLTATVGADSGPTAVGNVRFFDGIDVLQTAELSNGTVTVEAKLSQSGSHLLRATYLGDSRYSPASSVRKKE